VPGLTHRAPAAATARVGHPHFPGFIEV